MATANQVRKKNMVRYNGEICLVEEAIVRTPPNNRAYVQMELRSVVSGKAFPIRTSVGEEIEIVENRAKVLEYSYENQGEFVFVDPNTFDTYELTREVIGDAMDFITVGQKYDVLFVDERAIRVELPSSVIMKVTEAHDAVKGNSAGNVGKLVVVETGLQVEVPMFIKTGETIKVSTADKKYLGRA